MTGTAPSACECRIPTLQFLCLPRRHDLPPTLFEVLHNWLIFSILFAVIFPRLPIYRTTADPWDAVANLAYAFWHRPRRLSRTNSVGPQ